MERLIKKQKKIKATQLLIICLLLAACNFESKQSPTVLKNESISKSEVFNELVQTQAGDFNGVKIGMNISKVKELQERVPVFQENESLLQYEIIKKYTSTSLSYIFENKKLIQIAIDTEVNDSEDELDSQAAQVLFNDLKLLFLDQFGTKYLESSDLENTILFWTNDNKEIQLIKEQSNVHIYIDLIAS